MWHEMLQCTDRYFIPQSYLNMSTYKWHVWYFLYWIGFPTLISLFSSCNNETSLWLFMQEEWYLAHFYVDYFKNAHVHTYTEIHAHTHRDLKWDTFVAGEVQGVEWLQKEILIPGNEVNKKHGPKSNSIVKNSTPCSAALTPYFFLSPHYVHLRVHTSLHP